MIKDQRFLSEKASYCLDTAKKFGATDSSVVVSNSISETVNFRNKKLDESNRSDNLAIGITTYIGKRRSSISSSDINSLLSNTSFIDNPFSIASLATSAATSYPSFGTSAVTRIEFF